MYILKLIQWWWDSNVDWIKIHDPWVIPIMAISIPLSFVIRAVCAIVKTFQKK